MQFLNSLLLTSSYVLFIISFITHCQARCDGDKPHDDPPCMNKELYGEGKSCFFGYAGDVCAENMAETSRGNAQQFLKGVLHDYRFDFTISPPWIISIIAPEKGKKVYGMTYLFDAQYYEKEYVPAYTMVGMRYGTVSIEVTINDKKESILCNTLTAVNPPKKEKPIPEERRPEKGTIAKYRKIFKDAGFPEEYIAELSEIAESSGGGGESGGESRGKGGGESGGEGGGEGEGEE